MAQRSDHLRLAGSNPGPRGLSVIGQDTEQSYSPWSSWHLEWQLKSSVCERVNVKLL